MCRRLMSEDMGGGFILLVLLLSCIETAGGESSGITCQPPILGNGYFVPEKTSYPHGEKISYSCEKEYKPAVEGWWAIITCEDGTWSPKPECIDKTACFAPDVTNAVLRNNQTWYKHDDNERLNCNKGYVLKGSPTMKCENGEWTRTGLCEKSDDSCGEPPFVNNAVITQQYQDVFAVNDVITYTCGDSYTLDGNENIVCQGGGDWSEPKLTCKPSTQPTLPPREEKIPDDHGDGGKPETVDKEQPDRTHSGTKLIKDCGDPPVLDDGGIAFQDKWSLTYKCAPYYKLQGSEKVVCNSLGAWTTMPTCLVPCTIPGGQKPRDDMKELRTTQFLPSGDSVGFNCIRANYIARGTCIKGQMTYQQCESNRCTIVKGFRPRRDVKKLSETRDIQRGHSDWFRCDNAWVWSYSCGTCDMNGQMKYGQCMSYHTNSCPP